MRHGKALDASLMDDDAARPLTEKGIKKVQRIAEVLKNMDISPNVIFASPRVRAQQTAYHVAQVLSTPITTTEAVNFGFSVSQVKMLIQSYPMDAEVMFVGHNDSMSDVVTALTGANVSLEVGMVAGVSTLSPLLEHNRLVWLFGYEIAKAL